MIQSPIQSKRQDREKSGEWFCWVWGVWVGWRRWKKFEKGRLDNVGGSSQNMGKGREGVETLCQLKQSNNQSYKTI